MAPPTVQNSLEVQTAVLSLASTSLTICYEQGRGSRCRSCAIEYLFIVWAERNTGQLSIHYTEEIHNRLQVKTLAFPILENQTPELVESWLELFINHLYAKSRIRKNVKIFLNPFSGSGSAVKAYYKHADPIFTAARCRVDIQVTEYSGQAQDLIRDDPDINAWDVIACCSGDGLSHEIINGLAEREDAGKVLRQIPIIQLPGGTGNAMSVSLFGTSSISHAALYAIKGVPQRMDLMSISQGGSRSLSFLSQNLSYLAECDLDTEHLRFLGDARFSLGFFQRVFNPPLYACDIAFPQDIGETHYQETDVECEDLVNCSDEPDNRGLPRLRFGTVSDELPPGWKLEHHSDLSVLFAGKLPFIDANTNLFPRAKPDDGLVDIIQINKNISSHKFFKIIKAAANGSHLSMPEIHYRKTMAYRVSPTRTHGSLSVDGERFTFEPFQVEVHPRLGMTHVPPE